MHDTTTITTINDPDHAGPSVLATLRTLQPTRRLRLHEALRIAELQAERLLRLRGVTDVPVPIEIVTCLPRIVIEHDPDLPRHAASGASDWDTTQRAWVISINPDEPATRQRFTVLHEYKHILDHYHPGLGGSLPKTVYGLDPGEYVAEYFAGCVLMPKRWVKAAYYDGIQHTRDLAELFDVSPRAMQVRLNQLGITTPTDETVADRPRYRLQPRRGIARSHVWRPTMSVAHSTAPSSEAKA